MEGDCMTVNLDGLRCLVMGGSGFIGVNLCRALVASGATVRSFALAVPWTNDIVEEALMDVEWMCGSFSDGDLVRKSMRNIDIVFHLISTTLPATSNRDLQYDLASNLLPTLNMLDVAKNSSIQKVIF